MTKRNIVPQDFETGPSHFETPSRKPRISPVRIPVKGIVTLEELQGIIERTDATNEGAQDE